MAFVWVSGVMKIWVACWNFSMKASGGRRASPTKNTNSKRGRNCTFLQISFLFEIITGPQAEVESQYDQVRDVSGCLIKGGGRCGHDGVDDAHLGGLFLFNWGWG